MTERMIEELVLKGSDDWVMAAEVAWIAKSMGGASSDEDIRDVSIDLMRTALERDLVSVGDVTHDGFVEWDVSRDEALERIRRRWTAGEGGTPEIGEVCWLANTSKGDELAALARARGESDNPGTADQLQEQGTEQVFFPGIEDRDAVDDAVAAWAPTADGVLAAVRAWAQPADDEDETRTRVVGVLVDDAGAIAATRQACTAVIEEVVDGPIAVEVAVPAEDLPPHQQRLFDTGVVLWQATLGG